jgi:muramidase (phage lysozyme)
VDRSSAILLVFGLGAVALLAYSGVSFATVDPNAALPAPDPNAPQFDPVTGDPIVTATPAPAAAAAPDTATAVAAMLSTIRQFESNGNYSALSGGGTFSDFSTHPADPSKPAPAGWAKSSAGNWYNPKTNSSAAGAEQFIYSTWVRLAAKLGLTDFSPASQDAAAAELLNETGAVAALSNGDVIGAMRAASSQWASLPFAPPTANNRSQPLSVALSTYNGYLNA